MHVSRLSTVQRVLFALTAITLVLMAAYVCVRLTTLFASGYTAADATMAALLFAAELFLCFHGIGYFLSVVKAERRQQHATPLLFPPYHGAGARSATPLGVPHVAVLVAAFNESADVLEETLASVRALDYPAAHVYLIDDSTKTESQQGAARVAATYGAQLVHRTDRSGYKAGAINDLIPRLDEPYIALLDADQRPLEGWLKDLVPYMEANRDLAFVQVPQVYVNTEGLPVAEAAKYQQAVFFEYICEGKSHSNAMFCCGSNVIIRREALLSIGCTINGRRHYFDETSVTEDFATSFRLHAKGWRTDYINQPYVVGMGPETLPAYFTQQMRWAMGTLAVGLHVARRLINTPRALRPGQWLEYLLSGSYYFVGFANFIFMLAPLMFMVFDVRPLRANSNLYLFFFVPYIAFTMNLFFFGMWLRRYSIRGVWLASALSFATFWIYMKAAIVALFGLKRAFGVTPKGVGGAIPVSQMIPELVMCACNAGVALWGIYQLTIGGWSVAYVMNTVWAGYHAVLLSTLFVYFNKPVTIAPRRLLFEPAVPAAA
ncbi:MAG TPA: glycosyltransferase [Vicinamibacterales bacterium]|nr:glycosyltransferase [Vicinamibacterales bacterium]